MKNVILIAAYMVIAALTFGIVMTLHGREARSMELSSSLSSVAEEAVENAMLETNYKVETSELLAADFVENLAERLDTDSDITVNILKADKEEGILSVEVEETYKHLNGKKGSAACSRTVIFNRILEAEECSCEVRFYLTEEDMQNGQNCYKAYRVREGDSVTAPADPVQEGAQFNGWRDANGYLADFTQPVAEERLYYADWS